MSWYFCLEHGKAEPAGEACKADNRLGPYDTREQAENWRAKVEDRNDDWEEQDREWDGEEE